ncbi:hypothetical protein CEUSTIGMA_g12548.t1 [Chlamydomonas eustigma]|uniref:thiamine phosphate synthase n=1 Tax=Chlamydomonas eustigma TaxID=1157962 RepID=A0A250XPZ1_9CHLO|nr:hypothetical protein CEUSTIGMA_g12548.t1 [Chlamydomonas eustigma]|eukprot:GAX85128.1 hypothetical protein CEUSTIGMA_g12548.t1 [Chlamydomonas eustigma]
MRPLDRLVPHDLKTGAGGIGMLVVDFDETCSSKDTTGILMEAALQNRPAHSLSNLTGMAEETNFPNALTANYVTRQRELLSKLLPTADEVIESSPRPYNPQGLSEFLSQMSVFDVEMNAEAIQRGALQGLTLEAARKASALVQLRSHCRDTLDAAVKAGLPVHVLSVNWSRTFLTEALCMNGLLKPLKKEDLAAVEEGRVHVADLLQGSAGFVIGNEMLEHPNGSSSGMKLEALVQCAADKGKVFQWLTEYCNGNGAERKPVIYVGDSVSDLIPLLKADLGLVIGNNALLRRVASCFGIQLRPLATQPKAKVLLTRDAQPGSMLGSEPASNTSIESKVEERLLHLGSGESGVLYCVEDWQEIQDLLMLDARASLESASSKEISESDIRVPKVMVIAGSDSGGGAGIQADLKALFAMGAYGMTAVTALTAQNTHGVHAVHTPPTAFLAQQIDAIMSDIGADVIKTGMLPTAEVVQLVANKLRSQAHPLQLVVDPVMVSTSGHALADGSVAQALLRDLMPLATLVTPNLPEASALLGGMNIRSVEDMEEAAWQLQTLTQCRAVLVKGGHLLDVHGAGTSSLSSQQQQQVQQETVLTQGQTAAASIKHHDASHHSDDVVDVLVDGDQVWRLALPRVVTGNTHGTGCTLASAISAGLAKGLPLLQAVQEAKQYVRTALQVSSGLSIGTGVQRPFNHGYMLTTWTGDRSSSSSSSFGPTSYSHTASVGNSLPSGSSGRRVCPDVIRQAMRVYAVTDPGCNERAGRSMVEAVEQAVRGGATIVQIREKDAGGGSFLATARTAYQVCRSAGVPLIINDRVDIALAVGPDVGVHVGQDDMPAQAVRKLLGPSRILGVSVKTSAEADKAAQDGADYVGCGAVVATSTKDSSVIGLEGLKVVCETSPIPVVAIGGVSGVNAKEVINVGAAGIAVVSAIFSAPNVAVATASLVKIVDSALRDKCREF